MKSDATGRIRRIMKKKFDWGKMQGNERERRGEAEMNVGEIAEMIEKRGNCGNGQEMYM